MNRLRVTMPVLGLTFSALLLVTTGVRCARMKPEPSAKYEVPAGPYKSVYEGHFGSLTGLAAASVWEVGTAQVYPKPLDAMWSSCLDIVSQYDAVGYLSSGEHLLVVSHGMTILKTIPDDAADKGKKKEVPPKVRRYFDTLLAICVQPRGEGTEVRVAWLPPDALLPERLAELPPNLSADDLAKADEATCRKWATTIVATEFLRHLATQLLYEDRWRSRFSF